MGLSFSEATRQRDAEQVDQERQGTEATVSLVRDRTDTRLSTPAFYARRRGSPGTFGKKIGKVAPAEGRRVTATSSTETARTPPAPTPASSPERSRSPTATP